MARLHHEGRGLYQVPAVRTLFWLGLFVVLSVSLIVLDQLRQLGSAEDAASRVIVPVQTGLTERVNPVFEFWTTLGQIGQLQEENSKLKAQVQQLQLQNIEGQRAIAEDENMRTQLHYAQSSPSFKLIPATVVGKDLHGLDDYIEIDRGQLDGLQVKMSIVSPEGFLVGRIVSLNEHRARIMIVTNPSSSVAAIVADKDGQTEDVVDGKLNGRLSMTNIQQDAHVAKGDDVLTSGLGANFPKGLKIGQIATVQKSDVQLFQQADVAPYCDFAKLSAVEVITNNVPID